MSWQDRLAVAGLLLGVGLAAGLEGGVDLRLGGGVMSGMVLCAAFLLREGVPRPGRLARLGMLFVGLPLVVQLLPLPAGLRRAIAPGQAAWIDRVAPSSPDLGEWLGAWTVRDLDAALGSPSPVPDLLAGARAEGWSTLALAPDALPGELGLWGACALVFLAGRKLGGSEGATRAAALALLAFAVVETVLGLYWRDGPTTGLSPKTAYLGSATGSFVNRGHFAAFLALGIGACWGLAAGLFPLEPEEVRRHRKRKRRSSHPPTVLEAAGDKIPRLALLAFAVGLLSLGLVAANSRGPLLALAIAGAALGFWTWRRREEGTHLGIALAVPLAGVVLAVIALGPRGALGRFASLGFADVSFTSRIALWREGLAAFTDAPLFGAGLGAWPYAWAVHEAEAHLYFSRFAHQELLQWAVEAGALGVIGLLLLLAAWLDALRRGLDVAEEGPAAAMGVGLAVGPLAVILASLADFPLHIPGVALPTALSAGLALGAVAPPGGELRRLGPRTGAAVVAALLLYATGREIDRPGSRAQRLGEIPEIVYAWAPKDAAGALAWRAAADAATARRPLDPWAHAAAAKASSLLVGTSTGQPEDHALATELSIQRALALRPRDPRLLVYLADARLRIGRSLSLRDVFWKDAEAMLVKAVAMDAWRAEAAFAVADELDATALTAMAAAAPDTPMGHSRVGYAYGKALAARGDKQGALAAYEAAAQADPGFGGPAFEAGVLLYKAGREEDARPWFDRFLVARDRPGGMEGWALFYVKRYDAAESQFRKVIEDYPENRWAMEGLAEVGRATGDQVAERYALERMLGLDPKDARARARLKELDGG